MIGGLDIQFPELRSIKEFGYLVGFIIFAGISGYLAFFCSDDWFRMNEERLARWQINHSRLTAVASVFLLTAIVGFIVKDIWFDFTKR